MNTIIIEVSGGVVTQVTASNEAVNIIILDYDCDDATKEDEPIEVPDENNKPIKAMLENYTLHPQVARIGRTWAEEVIDAVTASETARTNPSED